jgi:hypothetical protein
MFDWTRLVPLAAAALLIVALSLPLNAVLMAACALMLFASVLAAVHHAEVVAHRVGEPFGTLVLALSVTAIELALILSMMLAGGPDKASLARDTIFATVMIISGDAPLGRGVVNGLGPDLIAYPAATVVRACGIPTFQPSSADAARQSLADAVAEVIPWPVDVITSGAARRRMAHVLDEAEPL